LQGLLPHLVLKIFASLIFISGFPFDLLFLMSVSDDFHLDRTDCQAYFAWQTTHFAWTPLFQLVKG
jgi:hypothetical protein